MSVFHLLRARSILTPIAAACVLAACATGKVTTAPETTPATAPATPEDATGSRPAPAGQPAKPRPPRSDKDTKPTAP
ncbi:hypothetical protein, partial [Zoogloea sp.]|uniref:hypothetical protein n=1 Tax=Zoogloea sp. TaxID=49181 RepID=UPI0031FD2C2D